MKCNTVFDIFMQRNLNNSTLPLKMYVSCDGTGNPAFIVQQVSAGVDINEIPFSWISVIGPYKKNAALQFLKSFAVASFFSRQSSKVLPGFCMF